MATEHEKGAVAVGAIKNLSGLKCAYDALIYWAIKGESVNARGIMLSESETEEIAGRVRKALRRSHPFDANARVPREYDRLMRQRREEEAEAVFDAPAPK